MCVDVNWGLEILKTVPTAIVGGIAAYIAWRQAGIAREQRDISTAKLKLDLFEKRLAIFHATWEAASRVIQDGPIYAPSSMTNLYPEASYLFGPEVEAYMKELGSKMTNLSMIQQMTQQNGNVVPPEKINERHQLETWIGNAASEGIRAIFTPYLNFAQWR